MCVARLWSIILPRHSQLFCKVCVEAPKLFQVLSKRERGNKVLLARSSWRLATSGGWRACQEMELVGLVQGVHDLVREHDAGRQLLLFQAKRCVASFHQEPRVLHGPFQSQRNDKTRVPRNSKPCDGRICLQACLCSHFSKRSSRFQPPDAFIVSASSRRGVLNLRSLAGHMVAKKRAQPEGRRKIVWHVEQVLGHGSHSLHRSLAT